LVVSLRVHGLLGSLTGPPDFRVLRVVEGL
jgi:hypothetical protein